MEYTRELPLFSLMRIKIHIYKGKPHLGMHVGLDGKASMSLPKRDCRFEFNGNPYVAYVWLLGIGLLNEMKSFSFLENGCRIEWNTKHCLI